MEILVKTYRGPLEDMLHTGHIAVVDSTGKLLWSCGDPYRFANARSSAKPLQAMCMMESGAAQKFGLTDEEISLCCASHNGEQMHVEAVRRVLAKAGLDESYLQCGVHYPFYAPDAERMQREGIKPTEIYCNCSGKHTGMLITGQAYGEELSDYYKPEHPIQQRIRKMIGMICDFDPQQIVMGTDGCGVPVHALPLNKFAYGIARMAKPETLGEHYGPMAQKITWCMSHYPLMMSGTGRLDARLMEKYPDKLFVKSGADGYFIIGIKEEGIGIAIKIDSGNSVARNAVVIEVLHQLGYLTQGDLKDLEDVHHPVTRNHKEEIVGEMKPVFTLHRAE